VPAAGGGAVESAVVAGLLDDPVELGGADGEVGGASLTAPWSWLLLEPGTAECERLVCWLVLGLGLTLPEKRLEAYMLPRRAVSVMLRPSPIRPDPMAGSMMDPARPRAYWAGSTPSRCICMMRLRSACFTFRFCNTQHRHTETVMDFGR
jgi:hypothetical protein